MSRWRAPEAWMRRRACRDRDPDPWFSNRVQDVVDARRVCDDCPVQALCLSWALEEEGLLRQVGPGMFGGKTPAERREMLGLKPLGKPGRPRKVRPGLTPSRVLEMMEIAKKDDNYVDYKNTGDEAHGGPDALTTGLVPLDLPQVRAGIVG